MDHTRPQMVPFESCPETAAAQPAALRSPRMLIEKPITTTKVPPRPRADMPILLAPDEVASLLGVSKTTLYRLVARRVLPFYRISGVLRFDHRDVEKFIARGRVEPVQHL